MKIIQYLINGISIGSVYAIIALGYTMVYGIAKMLNFAHGDVIMVGAYISFCVTNYLGLPVVVSILAAMAVCTLLGVLIEGLAYKPLRGTPSLAVLITAIGVSYFLQNAAQLIWSSSPKNFTSIVTFQPLRLAGGQLVVTGEVIYTIAASVIIMLGLTWFTTRTRTGKAMRAVSEDRDAAQLMGINVNQTISMTFAIGSGGSCRCAAVLHGSDLAAHHRLHARYPRLYRRGFRRHRLHSRGYAGRYSAGRHRDLQQSLSQPPVQRRDRVCRPDCDPAGEACRSAGQAGSGEGMRWML